MRDDDFDAIRGIFIAALAGLVLWTAAALWWLL